MHSPHRLREFNLGIRHSNHSNNPVLHAKEQPGDTTQPSDAAHHLANPVLPPRPAV
jgi:hypothetical protein